MLLTSGPTEQATTKGVTATLHLPGSPDFAVFAPDGLWVSIHGSDAKQNIAPSGQLLRINLATGTVQQTVPLSGSTSNLALDGNRLIADPGIAGTSTAGAAPGELIAVDTRTGAMLARRHQQIAGGPMAVGDGALWEIQESLRKDAHHARGAQPDNPRSDRAADGTQRNQLGATAWPGEAVCVGDRRRRRSAPNRPCHPRRSPARTSAASRSGSRSREAASGSSTTPTPPSNALIRARCARSDSQSRVPSGDNFYLGATDGYVFIADDSNGTITRIDTRTGKTAGPPIRIAPASSAGFGSAYAIAPAGTAIWATSPSTHTISRIQAKP